MVDWLVGWLFSQSVSLFVRFVNKSASGKIMRLTTDNVSEDSNHDLYSTVETKTQTFLPIYLYVIRTSVTAAASAHTIQKKLR